MANNEKRDTVQEYLLIAVMVVLIAAFIVAPILWSLITDVQILRDAWVVEIKKAKTITKQIEEDHILLHKED
jgi:ABC-type sugar transport system permease subunit